MPDPLSPITNLEFLNKQFDRQLSVAKAGSALTIQIKFLEPNPWQPRTDFSHVEGLAESIAANGGKLHQSISVRPHPDPVKRNAGYYQIGEGGTRTKAFQLLLERTGDQRFAKIPAIVHDYTDEEMKLIAFETAYHRKGLRLHDEIEGLEKLVKKDDTSKGYTHEELAERLKVPLRWVQNRTRLAGLSPAVYELFKDPECSLNLAHGLQLLRLKHPDSQLRTAQLAIREEMSKNRLETYITQLLNGELPPEAAPEESVPKQTRSPRPAASAFKPPKPVRKVIEQLEWNRVPDEKVVLLAREIESFVQDWLQKNV